MPLDIHNGFPLGCVLPDSFPTTSQTTADLITVLTKDQIKAEIVKRGGKAWNARSVFGDDWIKDQGPYGSCNGWSTSAALEKSQVRRQMPHVLLSGADAYSQMNGGSDRGSTLADGMKVVTSGIAPASLVTVNDIYSWKISAAAKAARIQHRGWNPVPADTEEEFCTGILLGFLGIIAVHVESGYDSLDSEGCPKSGNGPGNHSVHSDDLSIASDGELLIDSPNNWKVSWGDRGRCNYRWKRHLKETVKYHRFWLLLSTLDNPDGENPPPAQG